ncbi:hypothetical protein SCUCBS95973_002421 [Sporothrix curviconia]|uniref:DUF1746 domain-containing protein n=1 Tax=Sporothrix curviconia TaxID=1260050 RepID=A0ABP0B6R7_9PEZI
MNSNTDPGVGPSGSGRTSRSSGGGGGAHRTRRSRANTASRPRENRSVPGKVREGVKKKLGFYTDMMSQLDMLVFAELCALYYMDTSFFRFFLRAVAQSFFLSPKAEDFAIALDARKPHVLAILVPNLLCILAHSLGALPTASEANRGYLHGGVVIDFVGQTAPTSKLGLVLLDLVVLVVQCLMLAMHTEREKMRRLVTPIRTILATAAAAAMTTPAVAAANAAVIRAGGTPSPPPAAAANPPAATLQDHDAEERGVRPRPRAGTGAVAGSSTPSNNDASSAPSEDERLHNIDLGGPTGAASPEEAAEHELDALSSGSNIGDFYIIHAIRQAMQEKQGDSAAQSLQSIGYAVTLARLAAERRARARAAVAARPA